MEICVVGTGYVGLVTGACLADFGMNVTCVDKVTEKITALKNGKIPIYEPGLEVLVERNTKAGRLHFTTDLAIAARPARAIFIAVGTPPKEDGSADLSYVVKVAEEIAEHLHDYKVIITKSTVPIGTGQLIEGILEKRLDGKGDFSVVSNPEFLREGSAIEDFMRPDRVVLGARDQRAIGILREIYAPLDSLEVPFVITNTETSELIKYASNAFLATKITFINEVAGLCEKLGADVIQVARGMGLDSRIGPQFLHPGPGYGGSCFPKDTQALVDIARQAGCTFEIVDTVVRVNEKVKRRASEKVRAALDGDLEGKTVAVLGLSFKPGTDDIRDTPALPLIEGLLAGGAIVRAYDPASMENARQEFPAGITYCQDAYDAARDADALVLATEWNEFRSLDLERIRNLMTAPTLVDLRNVYDPILMRQRGFRYECLGRAPESLAVLTSSAG
ncbi:MAG: UDP-glucose/GDP-mannose dehydrogenase family protein [Thermoanaerobaculia bacterium]|nr:UDP-glucose/GDP-mannose dehydrogenase family protein [Thermoanaerobaculia bacterium]